MRAICKIENSEYSEKVREIENPEFWDIIQISKEYVKNSKDEKKIYDSLKRGTQIIEEEKQLYQYIKSYERGHQLKLEYAFDTISNKERTINIIDWGCGQALATCVLIDYIKEKKLNTSISDIILIEPSEPALSRGLLHLDVLKKNKINIKAVNKGIDSLEDSDLIFYNDNKTLHLFSNILDMESFRLDKQFFKKISNSQRGLNYFICVSPNISKKRNDRLDMFYGYFNDNFETKLISSRDDNIESYKRYEKIFQVTI